MAEREQCWLMMFDPIDPPPKLAVSMEELGKRHQAYIHGLQEKGHLFAAGAFRDENGARAGTGMIILRAPTRAQAETIARQEPYVANGVRTLKLIPWQKSYG